MKLSYVTVGANDVPAALAFYADLLASAGIAKLFDHPRGGAMFGAAGKPVLAVLAPEDGNPASPGNGTMAAFELDSSDAVDAFHARALALGGSDAGAPGQRAPGFYMAYFRDPEGNKFAACKLG